MLWLVPANAAFSGGKENLLSDLQTMLNSLDPNDPGMQYRREVIQAAINLGGRLKYQSGGIGDCNEKGERGFDCSGYASSIVGAIYQFQRRSSCDMHAKFREGQGLSEQGKPGDVVFFHKDPYKGNGEAIPGAASIVNHVGIYLGGNNFLHITEYGARVSSFLDFASPKGSPQKFTFQDRFVAYGSLDVLTPRTEAEQQELVAATGNVEEIRIEDTDEAGGVYISPALVLKAMRIDTSGTLDALAKMIQGMDFSKDPVQEIVLPPGFDR
jgi:cell wall-associated NlpC family hydrolase